MSEIEELRAEVAKLREEVERFRADRVVHHYHHQAQPAPFIGPAYQPPQWPVGPLPVTCAQRPDTSLWMNGQAITMGMSEGGIG